jgi:hypothetical protein
VTAKKLTSIEEIIKINSLAHRIYGGRYIDPTKPIFVIVER